MSVVLIPLGTHLQTQEPQFPEYERHVFAQIAAANPGRELGPGLMFAFFWPFTACFCVFIGLLYTGGLLAVRGLMRWRCEDGLLAAGAFGAGCLFGALMGLGEAMESFRWGFAALASGYLLSALGLGVGAIGTVGRCRSGPPSLPRPSAFARFKARPETGMVRGRDGAEGRERDHGGRRHEEKYRHPG